MGAGDASNELEHHCGCAVEGVALVRLHQRLREEGEPDAER